MRAAIVAGAAVLAFAGGAAEALGAANTTLSATIQDRDRDNRLEAAPGEDYVVRAELGQASPDRHRTAVELLFFGQLTDKHVVDEESPLRVEFLDKFGPPFTSAYRPQEAMSAHVVNEMVRQMRNTSSRVTGKQVELVMTTGDNSDNTQLNETRWMIDLLDGGKQINPNSGAEGTCDPNPGRLYDGVRGGNEYYEPDRSPGQAATADNVDGPGYSPNQVENEREAQRSSSVRDWPRLFEDANKPFLATGFDDLPWYGIFGNHDALIQGNQPRNSGFEALATGCAKPTSASSATLAQLEALTAGGLTPEERAQALAAAGQSLLSGGASSVLTPPDPARKPLRKREYIAEHFETTGTPDGHGFTAENQATGMGNYSFKPKPGLKFIVLDSIAEAGGDGGNIDDQQFDWIDAQLTEAEAGPDRELVMVFAHHSLETMNQSPVSPFPPAPDPDGPGGNLSADVHYGMNASEDRDTPCPATPVPNESLRCLFLRHPSVIAFVNGHEHANRITSFPRESSAGGEVAGGFWQVNTASHIDWPQQSRVLDLVDNGDGNLSIFSTILDHNGAPQPGGHPPSDGGGQSAEAVQRLASISRELSFNDPDASNGEDRPGDARGGPEDRNAELIVRNPYGP